MKQLILFILSLFLLTNLFSQTKPKQPQKKIYKFPLKTFSNCYFKPNNNTSETNLTLYEDTYLKVDETTGDILEGTTSHDIVFVPSNWKIGTSRYLQLTAKAETQITLLACRGNTGYKDIPAGEIAIFTTKYDIVTQNYCGSVEHHRESIAIPAGSRIEFATWKVNCKSCVDEIPNVENFTFIAQIMLSKNTNFFGKLYLKGAVLGFNFDGTITINN